MFYVIYNTETHNLLDITSVIPDAQQPEYTIAAFDKAIPDLYYYSWDRTLLDFVSKSNIDRVLTIYEFMMRFSAQERVAIKTAAKQDPVLSDFMDMLISAKFVDPNSSTVYGGLYYLALQGLIQQSRISEILS